MNNYKIINKIMSGGYGSVFKAQNQTSGQMVALKKIKHLDKNLEFATLRECFILNNFKHNNIIPLYNVTINYTHTILELMLAKGDLINLLEEHKNLTDRLELSKQILWEIGNALYFLHRNKIYHRDIKPDNILYHHKQNKYKFYLGDLGGSKFDDGEYFTSGVYTKHYCPAELHKYMKNKYLVYNHKVDIFSLGCTVIHFLYGHVDWKKFDHGGLTFEKLIDKLDHQVPQSYKTLLRKMLCENPRMRISTNEVLSHEIFKNKIYSIPKIRKNMMIGCSYLNKWADFGTLQRKKIINIMVENGIELNLSTITILFSKNLFDLFMSKIKPNTYTWDKIWRIAVGCVAIISTFREQHVPTLKKFCKINNINNLKNLFYYQRLILDTVNYNVIFKDPPSNLAYLKLNDVHKQPLFYK